MLPDRVQRIVLAHVSAAREPPVRSATYSATYSRSLGGGRSALEAATARHLASGKRWQAPALMQRLEDLLPLRVIQLCVLACRRHLFTLPGEERWPHVKSLHDNLQFVCNAVQKTARGMFLMRACALQPGDQERLLQTLHLKHVPVIPPVLTTGNCHSLALANLSQRQGIRLSSRERNFPSR